MIFFAIFGSIGSVIALVEYWLIRRSLLWILGFPAAAAVQEIGRENPYCGTPAAIVTSVFVCTLAGYAVAVVILLISRRMLRRKNAA